MIKYSENLPFGLEIISDSVIKKSGRYSLPESLAQVKRVVNHFINHPDPLVVPVYSWEDYYPNSKWYEYSYTMKRLGILSQEEKRIISLCIYHKTKFLSNNFLSEFKGEEINYPDLINFMYHVLSQNRYIDLHSQNFLKDEFGDYKLIDVEGFLTFPVDHRNLDWIKYEAS